MNFVIESIMPLSDFADRAALEDARARAVTEQTLVGRATDLVVPILQQRAVEVDEIMDAPEKEIQVIPSLTYIGFRSGTRTYRTGAFINLLWGESLPSSSQDYPDYSKVGVSVRPGRITVGSQAAVPLLSFLHTPSLLNRHITGELLFPQRIRNA